MNSFEYVDDLGPEKVIEITDPTGGRLSATGGRALRAARQSSWNFS